MPGNVLWGVHTALAANAAPDVLMIGDSWFWYPFDNLATELGGRFPRSTFVVIGRNGAEAAEWSGTARKAIDFGFDMYAGSVRALMLSGGGNDVAGRDDFLRLLNTDCSAFSQIGQCWKATQPLAIVTGIMNAYREVIVRFRAYNKSAPVFLHNYDHPWPTGAGVFGPADWLRDPMDLAKVRPAIQRELFTFLIDELGRAQALLAQEPGLGPVIAVGTAGALPDTDGGKSWWANELHPTPAGFRRLVSARLGGAMAPTLA